MIDNSKIDNIVGSLISRPGDRLLEHLQMRRLGPWQ